MFIVSAPSGTGKTTLCRAMTQIFPDLYCSVSFTTRPPRTGDVEGKDYYFISSEGFQKMIAREEFAEWAEIYGYFYGTSRILLEKIKEEGKDVILDIDGQGARQLRMKKMQGIFIFLLPPSIDELERRLSHRRTEEREAREERMKKAKAELAEARWYDYLVINDQLEKAKEELKAILLAEHCRRERRMESLEDLIGTG